MNFILGGRLVVTAVLSRQHYSLLSLLERKVPTGISSPNSNAVYFINARKMQSSTNVEAVM